MSSPALLYSVCNRKQKNASPIKKGVSNMKKSFIKIVRIIKRGFSDCDSTFVTNPSLYRNILIIEDIESFQLGGF